MSIKTIGREFLLKFPLLDGIFRRFIWSRLYFPENEMRILSNLNAGSIDVAVDVGAAMGSYSWILNRVSKKVYAFEPGHLHNKYLNGINFFTNIHVLPMAVGRTDDRVNLYTPGTDSNALHSATVSHGNPIVNLSEISVTHVDQVALDNFLSGKLALGQSVDLLKVDVEGYELDVFRGSIGMLSENHPLIICEIEARHNPNYSEVFSLLRELGYSCYIYRGGGVEKFSETRIEECQREEDLKVRLSEKYDPKSNRYINNFIFQHPQSHIKVKE